jgi:carboxyl-terminal processing protease
MSQRNLLILLLAMVLSYACYVRGEQNPYARYIASGLAAIDDGALDPVPERELFNGAMDGMVGVLRRYGDDHSEFLAEDDADPLRTEIRQQFGGIGVRIGFEGQPPRLTVVGPADPGAPAARANVLPGDRILKIDGQSTDGMKMSEVLRLMRGQPGTKVSLTIQHAHEETPRNIELVREVINIESILGDRRGDDGSWQFQLADDQRIAHIRIVSFGDRTSTEFDRVLENVMANGAVAAVIDLRDNTGGALESAVAICEMLLPAGKIIVETRGRDRKLRQRYQTSEDGKYLHLRVAVVVNQESASAAEIVAACLQDHQRAVVAGQRSYGKGTVQQLVPMESGRSLLKLTWASFWRPSGAKIHRTVGNQDDATWGVVPDAGFERKLSPEEYVAYQEYRNQRDMMRLTSSEDSAKDREQSVAAESADRQLEIAVNYLQGQLNDGSL